MREIGQTEAFIHDDTNLSLVFSEITVTPRIALQCHGSVVIPARTYPLAHGVDPYEPIRTFVSGRSSECEDRFLSARRDNVEAICNEVLPRAHPVTRGSFEREG